MQYHNTLQKNKMGQNKRKHLAYFSNREYIQLRRMGDACSGTTSEFYDWTPILPFGSRNTKKEGVPRCNETNPCK